ncbi:MAG: hypothetical protein WD009_10715 [Phycisphaeraceae bacterium]
MPQTTVSIAGDDFHINGRPTYPGRTWRDHRIEGLLMNSRMIQGIFDDLNPETRSRWDAPWGKWDAEHSTREFVAAMPAWREHGLVSFTVGLQGGSPTGYSREQPWHNSAFEADGSLRGDYFARLARILDKADELGMAPIVSYFYFGQDHRFHGDDAVLAATDNATDWLLDRGDRHVIIEIANEANIHYVQPLIQVERIHELVRRVQQRSEGKLDTPAGRLLVGASMSGGKVPPESLVEASDLLLLHGNGVKQPDRIREMVDQTRELSTFRGQPVVFNEDDHFDFDKPDNNMVAAVSKRASWGYFDYRMKGEGFEEGYQSMPADWGISSGRKRGFFGLLKEMTGGG